MTHATSWTRLAVGAVAICGTLTACGGEEPKAAPQPAPADTGTTTAEQADNETPDAAPQAATQKPPPAVTALGDEPIAAADLHDAYFHWNDATITVTGYPALFMDDVPWQQRVELGDAPEVESPALLDCDMTSRPDGRLTADTTLTLRGTVSGTGRTFAVRDGDPALITVEQCELVATGDPMPPAGDPWSLGAEPIPVGMLHEAMFGWQGMPVTVVGYYHSTTTSTTDGGTSTSHAISAGAGQPRIVECLQAGAAEAPATVVDRREGTMVTGTIGQPLGDIVVLDDCRFVQ